MPLIEEGWLESEITDQILCNIFSPCSTTESTRLCSAARIIRYCGQRSADCLGEKITLVDSAENCALAVRDLLTDENLLAAPENQAVLQVALTDPPDSFLNVAAEALQLEIGEVETRPL